MSKFQKKTSSLIVTIFIGLIVVSFMFGGYSTMQGTPDTIASVGNLSIKYPEFQRVFEQQLQFYQQMMGGKDLTSKQIEDFHLRQSALQSLVNKKLMIKLSEEIGSTPGNLEIQKSIIDMPYFKKDNHFDLDLYKNILASNRMSPASFEAAVTEDIKFSKIQSLMRIFPLSNNFLQDLVKYKSQKIKATVVQYDAKSLKKLIEVSPEEIKGYLSKQENIEKIKTIFTTKKDTLDKPEEIKARHILLKVTPKNESKVKKEIEQLAKKVTPANFIEMANKYTEDPSGKKRGGDLGWFAKGRMVAEFERVAFNQKTNTISAPVKTPFGYHLIWVEDKKAASIATFDAHKDSLANEQIQIQKSQDKNEMDKVTQILSKRVESLLQHNSKKTLDKLKSEYGLKIDNDIFINRLSGSSGQISLSQENLKRIFETDLSTDKVIQLEEPGKTIITRLAKPNKEELSKDQATIEKEREENSMTVSRQVLKDIDKQLRETYKVKVHQNIL